MSNVNLAKIIATAVAIGASQVAAQTNNKVESKDVPSIVRATTEAVSKSPELKDAQHQINVLTNQEPFWMSLQWWTAILGLFGTVAGLVGISFPAEMQKEVLGIIMALVGVISAGLMFYNRYIRRPAIADDLKTGSK